MLIENIQIDSTWKIILKDEFQKPYFTAIKNFLLEEKKSGHIVYPDSSHIFSAFNLTPFDQVKVVILGQDPYHGQGQSHGLCFSVPNGIKLPPSLRNIFKEISSDTGPSTLSSGDLTRWADQGVLLLNATLTVRKDVANSHKDIGWQNFTDAAISALSSQKNNIVFVLRGSYAQSKSSLIDTNRHLILTGPHPSPLSSYRGFFGCRHFSKTNKYLVTNNITPIIW